jgi:hypothetical protein
MGLNKLVDFSTSKLLKEKGFDTAVNLFYTDTGELWKQRKQIPTSNYNAYPKNPNSKLFYKYGYSAPTIAEVCMWLYEKHGIWISVTKDVDIKWSNDYFNYHILSPKGTTQSDIGGTQPNSPTEAYEAAIEYTLNNLI